MTAGFILVLNAGEHSLKIEILIKFYSSTLKSGAKLRNNSEKRRIISKEEALYDLKDVLPLLFNCFYHGFEMYSNRITHYPIQCRDRLLETSIFRSCVIEAFNENFADALKFGKYKRVIVRKNNYQILFKKLNNYNFPMNIVTKLIESIYNQHQLTLFNEDFGVTEPIIFFGYRKNRLGEMCNPKLVYIDDNRVRWMIEESDIERTLFAFEEKKSKSSNTVSLVKSKESLKRKKSS